MLWGRGEGVSRWGRPPTRPPPPFARRPSPGLTNVLEVQVVVEELVLLEVGVLGRVHVVLDVVLDLADGVHEDGVVVQHAQDGLQHAHVVAVLLDVPLQALDPVLLLLASPGPGSGAAGPALPLLPPQNPSSVPDPGGDPEAPLQPLRGLPALTPQGSRGSSHPELPGKC